MGFITSTKNYSTLYNHVNAPYIRKSFTLNNFNDAKLKISALGFYDLFINGKCITKGKMAPYISNPNDMVYYDEYDLKDILTNGKNCIGVILGNGFQNNVGGYPWGFEKADFRSAPILWLSLTIDGKDFLESDTTFKTHPSHIIFDDLRCGEYVDYRQEIEDWCNPDYDDSSWDNCLDGVSPKGEMKLCEAEPILAIEERKPICYWKTDGGIMFDFGTNSAGISKVSFSAEQGRTISLWHCECLVENHSFYNKNTCCPEFDRFMSQKDKIICNGKPFVFEPSFTYHGYRYVFVEGVDISELDRFDITMLVLSSSFGKTGEFTCSNETVNKLQQITVNSDRSNFFYFPTDCPQREKNGWTGDAALSCEQMLYNMDCSNSMIEWLNNIRKAQRDGGLPGIIPTIEFGYAWGNGPAWDKALVEQVYQVYRFSGDKKVLTDNKEAIREYLKFLTRKVNDNGLFSFGLGDWCETGSTAEWMYATPNEVTDSFTVIDICKKSIKIFSILNDKDGINLAEKILNDTVSNIKKKLLGSDLYIIPKTQTAQAMLVYSHILSKEEEKIAFNNLLELIKNADNHFFVGVLGARVLFEVLCDYGYQDLALELITKDSFPSYKYWLDNGATSLWEAFNEVYDGSAFRKDGNRVLSLNHQFWGDISRIFYKYILGININPKINNPYHFEISPKLFKDVDSAKGSYVKDGNGVEVVVQKVNGKLTINVKEIGKATYEIK